MKDRHGDLVFLLFVFLALPRLSGGGNQLVPYKKFFISLLWAFLALILSSTVFPPTDYANLGWVTTAFYRLIFSCIIVASLLNLHKSDRVILRWGLPLCCLVLALAYIFQSYNFHFSEYLKGLTPLVIEESRKYWNLKYYAFWQLFLMWGSVALLWKERLPSQILAVVILFFSIWAIFLTTSESSQLAAVISAVIFIVTHFANSKRWYLLYWMGIMTVIVIPLIWLCIVPVKPLVHESLLQIEPIKVRLELYDYIANLIRKEFVLGYGFGSTLFMPIPKGSIAHWLVIPGGHPHNFVFLFLIDHGLLGLIFLGGLLSLLFHYLFSATVGKRIAPAIWAMFVSGLIIFSLSFSIWKADVVLLYGMWLGLMFAIVSDCKESVAIWLENKKLLNMIILFGLLSLTSYAVEYLSL